MEFDPVAVDEDVPLADDDPEPDTLGLLVGDAPDDSDAVALGDEDLGAGYCCTGLMESLDMSLDNIEG